jgi:hypothetical protein
MRGKRKKGSKSKMSEMNRLEEELRAALSREQPSADFADRVMARIAQLPARPAGPDAAPRCADWLSRLAGFFQPPTKRAPMKWAMAGAMAGLLAVAGIGVKQHRDHARALEIAEGEKARQQVLLAMRIASAKLNVAQKKIQENHER